jgi:hypothetical protein
MPVVWFFIIGIVGTLALVLVSYLKWRWWVAVLVAFALTWTVTLFLGYPGPVHLGSQHWYDTSPTRELLLFALMLAGMASRVLSLAIEQHKLGSAPAANLQINRWDFIYPMLFAVPTFGALLSQLNAEVLSLPNVILAFQTGFFWQTILKKSELK